MTKYLESEPFSVHMGGSQQYRDNWDSIFAKKGSEAEDAEKVTYLPPIQFCNRAIVRHNESGREYVLCRLRCGDSEGTTTFTLVPYVVGDNRYLSALDGVVLSMSVILRDYTTTSRT